ncbi:acyl-CoA thioesterase [Jeotgalibacillus sp. ET6]|uniref:acyl-CoA thioesterase n=1 Tax=Jeotgalibacillus sp. ET6 TaxID=3037260 RepID=UPI002418B289|nr:acyl-CoA thioesterase [Jeotgalibacillus sp. ET6]MDG5470996.1 acyl-CoA thioesterase [Jeotgalibacillus sp. ET6]
MKSSYIVNLEEWKSEFSFYYEVKVRFSETDLFGHMNNTVPFIYFEQARIEFLKELGFMQKWMQPDHDSIPVVADLQCDFLQQVYFDQRIRLYVKAAGIGRSSVDLHYCGINEKQEVVFTGRGTMVQIYKSTGKSKHWSEEQRNAMEEKRNPSYVK